MGILDKFNKGYDVTSAYLKMGLFGEASSGKSTTAALTALALQKHLIAQNAPGANLPVAILDSEGGSDYIKHRFKAQGVELLTLKTKRCADLFAAMEDLPGNVSSLIIDSATHFWRDFVDSYKEKKGRKFLQMDDWGYLKPEWQSKYTTPFLNSHMHIFMCGRAGHEYDEQQKEDGKTKLVKVGVKMKAETESGYEPSLLLYLDTDQDTVNNKIIHNAYVFKDRFDLIHGKHFHFTVTEGEAQEEQIKRVWSWVAPHIKALNLAGKHVSINSDSSADIHPDSTGKPIWQYNAEMREIQMERIKALFEGEINVASADGKRRRNELLRVHAGVETLIELERKKWEEIAEIYEAMHVELRGMSSKDFIAKAQAEAMAATTGSHGGETKAKGSDDEQSAEVQKPQQPKSQGQQTPQGKTSGAGGETGTLDL
ncbi:MAG: hypothetical protein E6R03_11595 [Hyphomicrobiaceae bacterium]|nr:MAG: hypothetical protein E6R03_11595 [Hyphomicrobiaceae bacterium]